MRIDHLNPAALHGQRDPGPTANLVEQLGQSFQSMLDDVNRMQLEAGRKVEEFATTSNKDIHGTMIAMEKAGISLELLLQIRSKLINAYHEITRMQF